jgi:hypothetical protein
MKFIAFILISLILAAPLSSPAEERPIVTIAVQNSSMFRNFLQFRDDVCNTERSKECKYAEHIVDSGDCKKNEQVRNCREAREVLKSGACVDGFVYEGWLESGEVIKLDVCARHTGHAEISVRKGDGAPWTRYSWLTPDQVVQVK